MMMMIIMTMRRGISRRIMMLMAMMVGMMMRRRIMMKRMIKMMMAITKVILCRALTLSLGRKELADCVQCTPGMYCTPTGLSAPAGDCPGGYYCPLGTGPADSYPCPIGFYRNNSANEAFEVRAAGSGQIWAQNSRRHIGKLYMINMIDIFEKS